ncbi:MAG: rod shape-determining protein MreD [Bacillota bacterium]|jgi:rod shape-determining protein MreD
MLKYMLNQRRILTIIVLYIAAVIFQYGILNNLGWGIFCPQLLLFFPIYGGILDGSKTGMILGGISGFLMDLIIGRFIGIGLLVWLIIGWLAGKYGSPFYKENYILPLVAVAVCITAGNLLYALLIGIVGSYWIGLSQLEGIIIGGLIINCVIAPIIYLPVYRSACSGYLRKRRLGD